MKKISTLLFVLCFCTIAAWAQPSLTQSNLAPYVGETVNDVSVFVDSAISPGPAGANQTWSIINVSNYFDIPPQVASGTYTTATGAANVSNFPGANIVAGPNFFDISSSSLKFLGQYNDDTDNLIYTTPEIQLVFPFTYNTTATNNWAATGISQGSTFHRTGTTTVTGDAYGTITTPAGTYTNALRVHLLEVYQDDIGVSYINDEYAWYTPNNHNYLAFMYTLTTIYTSVNDTSLNYFYGYSGTSDGINSINPIIGSINLFPNPSCSLTMLSFNAEKSTSLGLYITNYLGQEVKSLGVFNTTEGKNEISISTADLATGIYFVAIRNKQGILVDSRRLVIAR